MDGVESLNRFPAMVFSQLAKLLVWREWLLRYFKPVSTPRIL